MNRVLKSGERGLENRDWRGDTLVFQRGSRISIDINKAHGLTGTLVEPDWPPLTLEEADRLLRRYPQAGGAVRLLSFSPRPFSAGCVLATREGPDSVHGKVFVKRHSRLVRGRDGLMEEHRLIEYLAGRTDLVQAPLADEDGETAIADGDWVYEVHPLARGVDVYEQALSWTPFLNPGHARGAGRAMAELHRAARGYGAPARQPQQLVTSFSIFASDDPIATTERYIDARPRLEEYMEKRRWRELMKELMLPLAGELAPWLGSLKPLWTHNDFHASNLTWRDAGSDAEVRGVIDFGLADRTNAVHDLATAIERNTIEWLRMGERGGGHVGPGLVHGDHLDALLNGYEEISPLNYGDARALGAILPLIHCEFALSETDYFLSVLHSEEKAHLAYEGYFEEHARWFQSPQGCSLLERLRNWAEREGRKAVAS